MKRNLLYFCAAAITAAMPLASSAAIFSDNFDTENGGASQLNYGSFANWDISNGTVDLIANGYGGLSGSGVFVDLDGSTNNAGKMTTKTSFALTGGMTYRLSFDLCGNQRANQVDNTTVTFESFSQTYSLVFNSGWKHYDVDVYVASNTTSTIMFEHDGFDNIGMLLDNVELNLVPEPGSLAVLGLGAFALLRKRK